MVRLSEHDVGKTVFDPDGDEIGTVVEVAHGTAHVDPATSRTDRVLSTLGLTTVDEDAYTLEAGDVTDVTDDAVHLRR